MFLHHILLRLFPIITYLREYNLREDLLHDFFAGVTVFVMASPQGMAYGILTGLGPVYGLYTCTFPVFMYIFLGTSKHLAIGVATATSLMVQSAVARFMSNLPPEVLVIEPDPRNDSSTPAPGALYVLDNCTYSRKELELLVNASLTMLVGIVQLTMGVCRLGFITRFFSSPMIRGYITGIAIHTFSNQVRYILGYNVPENHRTEAFKLFYLYFDIILDISKFNWLAFAISVFSITTLVISKEILQQKLDRIPWYPKLPFPMELILVIVFILLSKLFDFANREIAIVGQIQPGLPKLIIPYLTFWKLIYIDAILLAILSYSVAISLATIFAAEHSYRLDNNQELIALGAGNILGTFFQCFVATGSVARSNIQNNSKAKSQIVSLFHFIGMILLLLFIAPIFKGLPKSVLGAVVVVALKKMLWQVTDLPRLWKTSLMDFTVWLSTFLVTIIFDVDQGLIFGFGVTFCSIVARAIISHSSLLARSSSSPIFVETSVYPKASEVRAVKVFRYEGALCFASFHYFLATLVRKTGLAPIHPFYLQSPSTAALGGSQYRKMNESFATERTPLLASADVGYSDIVEVDGVFSHTCTSACQTGSLMSREGELCNFNCERRRVDHDSNRRPIEDAPLDFSTGLANHSRGAMGFINVQCIVLDCSGWSYIDDTSTTYLFEMLSGYRQLNIEVYLTQCNAKVRKMLLNSTYSNEFKIRMFVTIDDAVMYIRESKI